MYSITKTNNKLFDLRNKNGKMIGLISPFILTLWYASRLITFKNFQTKQLKICLLHRNAVEFCQKYGIHLQFVFNGLF